MNCELITKLVYMTYYIKTAPAFDTMHAVLYFEHVLPAAVWMRELPRVAIRKTTRRHTSRRQANSVHISRDKPSRNIYNRSHELSRRMLAHSFNTRLYPAYSFGKQKRALTVPGYRHRQGQCVAVADASNAAAIVDGSTRSECIVC